METTERLLQVTGVSHRVLPDDVLALVIPGAAEGGVLEAELARTGVPHVLLVTCNRLECYWMGDATAPHEVLQRWVRSRAGAEASRSLGRLTGTRALQHVVRVAAGLESMLAGDTDVLGQVRRTWLASRAAAVTDRCLDRVFERVIHAARRVQRDVPPNAAAQSIGAAAVQAIHARLHSRWDEAVVAVVGSGAAASSALAAMGSHRPRSVHLTGRTPERVTQLAGKTGAQSVAWQERDALIRRADVTVFAVRADVPLFVDADAAHLLAHREGDAPALWADLGMPPNVAITTTLPTLQLLTLPALMRAVPVSDEAAVHEAVSRELVYLHAALQPRRPSGSAAMLGLHARTA
jgi:glutamyl-tRNA reductase